MVPSSKEILKERLVRYRQIKVSVIGRKSGTQWYKNVLQNPSIGIDARGVEADFQAVPITNAKGVKSVNREVPGEVRGEGREEVLFDIRRGACG